MIKIPNDFPRYWEEEDINFQGDEDFDRKMLEKGYFEHCWGGRNYRTITEKLHNSDYFDVCADLLDIDVAEYKRKCAEDVERTELKELKRLADKYGYILVPPEED